MSEEEKLKEQECKCFFHSKEFKRFLTIALGTFVGVYCALCLFTALHKPPMILPAPPNQNAIMNGCPFKMIQHHQHFGRWDRANRDEFKKPEKIQGGPAPFDTNRTEFRK